MPVIELGKLPEQKSEEIVKKTLGEYRKKLGIDKNRGINQMQLLLNKEEATKPLYLTIACEELRTYPRFEEISLRIKQMPDTIPLLFEQVLDRLEHDHGRKLVTDTKASP